MNELKDIFNRLGYDIDQSIIDNLYDINKRNISSTDKIQRMSLILDRLTKDRLLSIYLANICYGVIL